MIVNSKDFLYSRKIFNIFYNKVSINSGRRFLRVLLKKYRNIFIIKVDFHIPRNQFCRLKSTFLNPILNT